MEQGAIRLVCVSDTHSQHKKLDLPPGDVLVHAGDFTSRGKKKEIKSFARWLDSADFSCKIVIAGNHDFAFDINNYEKSRWTNKTQSAEVIQTLKEQVTSRCIYLQDSGVEIYGYKF